MDYKDSRNELEENNNDIVSEQDKSNKKIWRLIIIISVILLIVSISIFIIVKITSNNNSNDNPTEDSGIIRSLKSTDYTMTYVYNLTSYQITIIPNRDISTCTVELTLNDHYGAQIYNEWIIKHDLHEGELYTYIFEHGMVILVSDNQTSIEVTGYCYE